MRCNCLPPSVCLDMLNTFTKLVKQRVFRQVLSAAASHECFNCDSLANTGHQACEFQPLWPGSWGVRQGEHALCAALPSSACLLWQVHICDFSRGWHDSSFTFRQDVDVINTLTRSLKCGTVWVNSFGAIDAAQPFGGACVRACLGLLYACAWLEADPYMTSQPNIFVSSDARVQAVRHRS